jgi:hypothetical protein
MSRFTEDVTEALAGLLGLGTIVSALSFFPHTGLALLSLVSDASLLPYGVAGYGLHLLAIITLATAFLICITPSMERRRKREREREEAWRESQRERERQEAEQRRLLSTPGEVPESAARESTPRRPGRPPAAVPMAPIRTPPARPTPPPPPEVIIRLPSRTVRELEDATKRTSPPDPPRPVAKPPGPSPAAQPPPAAPPRPPQPSRASAWAGFQNHVIDVNLRQTR